MRDDTLVVPVDGGLIRGQRSGTVETWRNSVHLAVRQRCSSSSPSVHYDSGFIVGGTSRLVAKTEFRLFPRGAEPLEPLPGVRFESTRVHPLIDVQPLTLGMCQGLSRL